MRGPRSKRRWRQFSLRTLLLFVLATAVAFALLGQEMGQARREKEAVAELSKVGVCVVFGGGG
jgi:hypothetical protein